MSAPYRHQVEIWSAARREPRTECDVGKGYVLDRGLAYRVVGSTMKRQLRTGPTDGRRDKSTAVARGACRWLDWIFLSAHTSVLLAHSSESTTISGVRATSPASILRDRAVSIQRDFGQRRPGQDKEQPAKGVNLA